MSELIDSEEEKKDFLEVCRNLNESGRIFSLVTKTYSGFESYQLGDYYTTISLTNGNMLQRTVPYERVSVGSTHMDAGDYVRKDWSPEFNIGVQCVFQGGTEHCIWSTEEYRPEKQELSCLKMLESKAKKFIEIKIEEYERVRMRVAKELNYQLGIV